MFFLDSPFDFVLTFFHFILLLLPSFLSFLFPTMADKAQNVMLAEKWEENVVSHPIFLSFSLLIFACNVSIPREKNRYKKKLYMKSLFFFLVSFFSGSLWLLHL